MVLYNTKPRPRALIIGLDDQDEESQEILALFPYSKILSDVNELDKVRQSEYDIAVTFGERDVSSVDMNLPIVCIGYSRQVLGSVIHGGIHGRLYVLADASVATELNIEETLDDTTKKLVQETLLPIFVGEAKHDVIESEVVQQSAWQRANLWSALVTDGDNKVLCGWALRSSSPISEIWYLPWQLSMHDICTWLKLIMKRWAEWDPESFPSGENWGTNPLWQSADEIRLNNTLADAESQLKQIITSHEATINEIKADLLAASAAAANGPRVLLTGQGEPLKNVVLKTLQGFGFSVSDMDKEKTDKEAKLEDLRVQGPNNWTALTEVKGYKKGARFNDLLKLSRFTIRYAQDNKGALPEKIWYIVNHSLQDDPQTRELPLQQHPKEMATFEETDGVVIDTIDLFRLRQAVETGSISADKAKKLLMTASGRFKYPASEK